MRNKRIIKVKNIKKNIYYKNNSNLFLTLLKLINENNTQYASMLTGKKTSEKRSNTKYSEVYQWINQQLTILKDPIYTIKTKCYWIINNIQSFNDKLVQCHTCKKPFIKKNVINVFVGYSERGYSYSYCCKKCAACNQLTKNNRKKTCTKKYNVKYTFQTENNKKKSKATNNKKYNVDYYVQSVEFKEKSKYTKYKRYND